MCNSINNAYNCTKNAAIFTKILIALLNAALQNKGKCNLNCIRKAISQTIIITQSHMRAKLLKMVKGAHE